MRFTNGDPSRVHRPISLTGMVGITHQLKARCPVPIKEYRIHPDDYTELQARLKAENVTFPADDQVQSFLGLRLVLDESAPRLPRIA